MIASAIASLDRGAWVSLIDRRAGGSGARPARCHPVHPPAKQGEHREPSQYTPELSRRARGVEVWAALHSLGRTGLCDLIERTCRLAGRFAVELKRGGCEVLNEVVLNQVLVSFGDAARTKNVIERVQKDGTCWCGPTEWQGRTAMRISVSSWATRDEDVDRSVAAILRAASA